MIKKRILLAKSALVVLMISPLCAVELLTDGGFEFATGMPGWDFQESIYDQGTMMPRNFGDVNSGEQIGFAPISGDLDLWLRAFVGGSGPNPDALSNATLSQTVDAVPGQEYEFSGWSRWESVYSGGVTTLNASGPLGAVPSPTDTRMKLEFLNDMGVVLGGTELDLRDQQNNFDNWVKHTLTETAPGGTVAVRVTAEATAMVWNGGGSESAFYDNFSLTNPVAEGIELLANADLEEILPPFDPDAYTITEVPGGNLPDDETVLVADFANRPDSGGQLGAWLKSFVGDAAQPADAIISQTVPGMPGADYTFSAWSNFQTNYSGGDLSFGTQTLLEMAFLDGAGTELEAPLVLDLVDDGQTNGAGWMQHMLNGTAPAGTVSVRVTAAGLDMETNPAGGQQSAFFDDLSLIVPDTVDCDFDGMTGANGFACDVEDINMLMAEIASGMDNPDFDLNGDNVVDNADRDQWLDDAGNMNIGAAYLVADFNLDGNVDGQDFVAWNGSKFTANTDWTAGNANGDSMVDGQDFVAWNGNKFMSSGDGINAVPEPAAGLLILLAASLAFHARRI